MERIVEYEGPVCVRPAARGILLGGGENLGGPYLEDEIEAALLRESEAGSWEGRLRIVVERLDD
jgi:hypothetical protein